MATLFPHLRRSFMRSVVLSVGLAWVSCPGALGAVPEGTWIVSDRVAIKVFECSGHLCGQIAWLRNPKLRIREMCGRVIVWGLTPVGPVRWTSECSLMKKTR